MMLLSLLLITASPHVATADLPVGGGACTTARDCQLAGECKNSKCVCDPQWDGLHCGGLALLPADPEGGYRRPGFSGWGGNPWYDAGDKKCASWPALLCAPLCWQTHAVVCGACSEI